MFTKNRLKYEALPLPHRHGFSDEDMLIRAGEHYAFMKTRNTVRDYDRRHVDYAVIEHCIRTAGTAPSGANHQPWHFVAISDPAMKTQIRLAAEAEEIEFYQGGAGDEWLKALEPIGTGASKPHLEDAPWLIVIFAQRWGVFDDGTRYKNYYVPESVGIATGFLISALHHAGLCSLTHTPNPMKFLNGLLNRPEHEKPVMILAVGHPSQAAVIPEVATYKKSVGDLVTVHS